MDFFVRNSLCHHWLTVEQYYFFFLRKTFSKNHYLIKNFCVVGTVWVTRVTIGLLMSTRGEKIGHVFTISYEDWSQKCRGGSLHVRGCIHVIPPLTRDGWRVRTFFFSIFLRSLLVQFSMHLTCECIMHSLIYEKKKIYYVRKKILFDTM